MGITDLKGLSSNRDHRHSFDLSSHILFDLPYKTLPEALEAAPKGKPFATMWQGEDDVQSFSFGEFIELAETQAAYLQQQGLKAGDTIVLIMPQGIPLMASFAAAMCLGAIQAILAYPNFKVEPAKYRAGLTAVTANLKARLVMLEEEFPEDLLGHVTLGEFSKLVRYEKGASRERAQPAPPPDPGHVAFIQHSAGTTGLQKGVALSHSAVLY